jgi:hypothetical protein
MGDRKAHHCATAVGIFQVRKFWLILQTFSQVEDKTTLTSLPCVLLMLNFLKKIQISISKIREKQNHWSRELNTRLFWKLIKATSPEKRRQIAQLISSKSSPIDQARARKSGKLVYIMPLISPFLLAKLKIQNSKMKWFWRVFNRHN